jgi:phosphotriesterase-related protein
VLPQSTPHPQRPARTGEVQTVLGPVAPAALGVTLMHEHLLCDVTPPELAARGLPDVEITLSNVFDIRHNWCLHYGNHILRSVDDLVDEAALFRAAGGGTIVELTTTGMKPDPVGLSAISARSGVHVVAGCGTYIESFAGEALTAKSVDALAHEMICAVREGFGETGIRPGIIGEIGISDPWTAAEQRALQAAAVAQEETGASVNVHPGRDPASPSRIIGLFRSMGGRPDRLVLSHMDRTIMSEDGLLPLLDAGSVVEWDFFGIESSYYPFAPIDLPNDGMRLDLILRLVTRGYRDRIAVSHDICTKTRLVRYGGHGYSHLLVNVVPVMRRKGFSEEDVEALFIGTPARLLTLS